MKKYHEVTEIKVTDGVLSVAVDGNLLSKDLRTLSPILRSASDEELSVFEISPSGYGIHWSRVDEDVSIDGLLGIKHAPGEVKQSA